MCTKLANDFHIDPLDMECKTQLVLFFFLPMQYDEEGEEADDEVTIFPFILGRKKAMLWICLCCNNLLSSLKYLLSYALWLFKINISPPFLSFFCFKQEGEEEADEENDPDYDPKVGICSLSKVFFIPGKLGAKLAFNFNSVLHL